MLPKDLQKIVDLLRAGEIIAYPTEGIFGLGSDPFNESAVKKLLALKQRPMEKGLIVIATDWREVEKWIGEMPGDRRGFMQQIQVEPITWVMPASDKVPVWIRGKHHSVAIRITDHPVAKAICEEFGGPLVSTSANLSNEVPCLTYEETIKCFAGKVAYIVDAPTGGLNKPTKICDALTGKVLR